MESALMAGRCYKAKMENLKKSSVSLLHSVAGYGILRGVPLKRVCEVKAAERKCANANDLTRSAADQKWPLSPAERVACIHEVKAMQSREKTAGKTANGGARCVALVNAMNAGLALGGVWLVSAVAGDGAAHAMTVGALLAAAVGCLALVAMAGGEVRNA